MLYLLFTYIFRRKLCKKHFILCDAEYAKKYFSENGIIFDHAYSSTQERASDTLELVTDLMNDPTAQTVLAVSHGAASYFFTLKHFPEVDLSKVKFSNCCILKWTYAEGVFTFVEAIDHDFSQPL